MDINIIRKTSLVHLKMRSYLLEWIAPLALSLRLLVKEIIDTQNKIIIPPRGQTCTNEVKTKKQRKKKQEEIWIISDGED